MDKIGYLDDAYNYAKSAAGLGVVKVVRYEDPPTLAKLFSVESASNLAGGRASADGKVTVNGVNIDVRDLSELIVPRPLYLWARELTVGRVKRSSYVIGIMGLW